MVFGGAAPCRAADQRLDGLVGHAGRPAAGARRRARRRRGTRAARRGPRGDPRRGLPARRVAADDLRRAVQPGVPAVRRPVDVAGRPTGRPCTAAGRSTSTTASSPSRSRLDDRHGPAADVGQPAGRASCASRVAVEAGGAVDLRLRADLAAAGRAPLRRRGRRALGVEIPVDGAPLHEPDVAEPLRYAGRGPVAGGYDPFGAVAVAIDTDGEVDRRRTATWSVRGMSPGADHAGELHERRRFLVTAAGDRPGDAGPGSAARARSAAGQVSPRRSAPTRCCRAHEADLRALLGGTSLIIGARRGGTVRRRRRRPRPARTNG